MAVVARHLKIALRWPACMHTSYKTFNWEQHIRPVFLGFWPSVWEIRQKCWKRWKQASPTFSKPVNSRSLQPGLTKPWSSDFQPKAAFNSRLASVSNTWKSRIQTCCMGNKGPFRGIAFTQKVVRWLLVWRRRCVCVSAQVLLETTSTFMSVLNEFWVCSTRDLLPTCHCCLVLYSSSSCNRRGWEEKAAGVSSRKL